MCSRNCIIIVIINIIVYFVVVVLCQNRQVIVTSFAGVGIVWVPLSVPIVGAHATSGENRCRGLMEDDSSIVIEDACGEDGMRNLQSFTKYQAFRVT